MAAEQKLVSNSWISVLYFDLPIKKTALW